MSNNSCSWMEYFRLVTPILLFLLGLYINTIKTDLGYIRADIADTKNQVFHHLTNDELHAPRSLVVLKPEWDIYQTMRTKEMLAFSQQLAAVAEDVKDIKKSMTK